MIKGIAPSLAEGGKIKIGGLGKAVTSRQGNVFRPPVKLDHFIITTTQRDAAGDLIPDLDLMGALTKGDEPIREIPIVLHSDTIEQVFPTTYALYTGKKLFCHGDGELATRYELKNNQRTGLQKEMPCPCPYLGAAQGPICKPHGTLHCSIRVPGKAVAGSVYKWRTTSIISIQRMLGSLDQILSVCGTLTGIPLVLRLEAIQVSPPNAPASTVYCCHIELRAADILEIQKQAIASAQMRLNVRKAIAYRALITPPAEDEDDGEQAEIGQEFHPEVEPVPVPQLVATAPAPEVPTAAVVPAALSGEPTDQPAPPATVPGRKGRPPGAKNKPKNGDAVPAAPVVAETPPPAPPLVAAEAPPPPTDSGEEWFS
jgi:hypothetical protein